MGRYLTALARLAAVALALTSVLAGAALAQDRRQGEPGQFDFYVLALSWSPSYCESAQTRAPNRSPDQQCSGRPFAFVVHGLWPQYERGFPSYCQVPAPRLNHAIVGRMLDLMPSARLIFHEWDRHGTCTGVEPAILLRECAEGSLCCGDPAGLSRARQAGIGNARRSGGRIHQGQSRAFA